MKEHFASTIPAYRRDIDGLRAVAVLLVVGFHAFPRAIQGGFIGVDIFFVISGYLISTILFKNFEQNDHDLITFYQRRIRRIFPALVAVLITALALGWFGLLPDEFAQLGRHVLGGTAFISNFILWHESGYFDNVAETKPLLHLWSLGVEEQFYIFYPVILWIASKCRLNLLIVTLAIAIGSFGLNLHASDTDPVGDFFSPQTRFWELMIGSVLAYVNLHWPHVIKVRSATRFQHMNPLAVCSILGFILIVIAGLKINRNVAFPGAWALLPTFGAALLILAGPNAPVNRVLLSSRLAVWFGKISYPLYLWHWLFLSIAHVKISATPSLSYRGLLVGLSVLLAWITYRFIERPLRFGPRGGIKAFGLTIALALTGFAGYLVDHTEGFPIRIADRKDFLDFFDNTRPAWNYFEREGILKTLRDDCNFYNLDAYRAGHSSNIPRTAISKTCHQKQHPEKHTVLVWGDSHAQHLYHGLERFLPADWELLIVSSSGCLANPNATIDYPDNYCGHSNYVAIQTIKEARPEVVVVAQNIGHSAESMREIARSLLRMGVGRVIFPGPTPHWTSDLPRVIARDLWPNTPQRTKRALDMEIMAADERLKTETAGDLNFTYLSIIDVFCNEDGCLTYLGQDRMKGITSADYGHLTPAASEYLAEKALAQAVFGSSADATINSKLKR